MLSDIIRPYGDIGETLICVQIKCICILIAKITYIPANTINFCFYLYKKTALQILQSSFKKLFTPATSYFPGQSPTKYHQRCRA